MAKTDSDAKMWKTKYETEASSRIEELEEENGKLKAKIDESQIVAMDLESKLAGEKKKKNKALDELKEARQETEYQKRKLEEGHKKVQDLCQTNEKLKTEIEILKLDLETSRRDILSSQSEVNRARLENDDLKHQIGVYREESSVLQSKLVKHEEELQYLERKVLELEHLKKRADTEKDDLIMAMDDLEFALERAESKHGAVLKETEKMRGEYEQRMEEREQEGRQAMMRLQALLEAEKSKSENDRKTHNEAIR